MSIQLNSRVPDDWLPRIERAAEEAGFPIEVPRGKAGGVSLWIRSLIARELGEEVVDPHEKQSRHWAKQRAKKS